MYNLLGTYEAILLASGYIVDDKGTVRKPLNEEGETPRSVPAVIEVDDEQKGFVLPTKNNLRSMENLNKIIFHPFVENTARGESKVLTWIRRELGCTYGHKVARLIIAASRVSANVAGGDNLNNEQRTLLSKLGAVDAKLLESIEKIIVAQSKRNSKQYPVVISLRRGGKDKNGDKMSRTAHVSFPLAEEIAKVVNESGKGSSKPIIYGVPVRKGDLPVLTQLMNAFFPNWNKPEQWVFGSNSTDAPFMECFLIALHAVASHTNHISETLYGYNNIDGEELDKHNLSITSLPVDFIGEDFAVSKFRKELVMIPMQDGNEGEVRLDDVGKVNIANKAPAPTINKWENVTEEVKPVQSSGLPNNQPIALAQQQTVTQTAQAPQAPTSTASKMSAFLNNAASTNPNTAHLHQSATPKIMVEKRDSFGNVYYTEKEAPTTNSWTSPMTPTYSNGPLPVGVRANQIQQMGGMVNGMVGGKRDGFGNLTGGTPLNNMYNPSALGQQPMGLGGQSNIQSNMMNNGMSSNGRFIPAGAMGNNLRGGGTFNTNLSRMNAGNTNNEASMNSFNIRNLA